MSAINFQAFTLDPTCDWLWYSDGLNFADIAKKPLGFRFMAVYAPVGNLKTWLLIRYEIRMVTDAVRKHSYRAYVAIERVELAGSPFEVEAPQEDASEA